MSEISVKTIVGIVIASILLVVVVVMFFGGSPDVMNGTEAERIAAIEQITIDGDSGAAETLIEVVDSPAPTKVRQRALAGLSHFLKPVHRKTIIKCAKDPDPVIRSIAYDSLGVYGDKDAATELIAVIEKKKDKEPEGNQIAAIRALAKCDDPRSIVTLMGRAEHGVTSDIKLEAMTELLTKLGVRIALERNPKDDKGWRDLIQRWKESRRVQKAFDLAEEKVISRPQDKLGKDWHPERRNRR
jgi:HEAT repeat protein